MSRGVAGIAGVDGVAVRALVEICVDDFSAVLRTTLRLLGWIDAPHTQNFEILKFLEQTQESKNFKIIFDIFVKMLEGLNFGRKFLLRCSI
jgi:hypothetical protein